MSPVKKVLLGTPIHQCKDYSMERWLKSLSKFEFPFDLLMVDNSPNPEYLKKVHNYCQETGISSYELLHIDISQDMVLDERLARSREIIRQKVLTGGYDVWFSLECDIIVPSDALSKLICLVDDYPVVSHVYPGRGNPDQINQQLGVTLVNRQVLEKYSFAKGYGYINPKRPDSWYGSDVWFMRQVDIGKIGKHINIGGIIKPIYHLNV